MCLIPAALGYDRGHDVGGESHRRWALVFATMRRKRRSTKMKNELGQSVDHFRKAASLAALETSATVGPKISAAKDRVQPAVTQVRDTASSGWESAVATITPLVATAAESVRQAGADTKKSAKVNKKRARKNAKKLEKRANKALNRNQSSGRGSKLVGIALVGAALGVAAAYVVRKRQAQWDEYDPEAPIAADDSIDGADDSAFEPDSPVKITNPEVARTSNE